MDNMHNRLYVDTALIHQPVDIKGFLSKKTLSSKDMGAMMIFDSLGLHVTFRGATVLIPSANVAAVCVGTPPDLGPKVITPDYDTAG